MKKAIASRRRRLVKRVLVGLVGSLALAVIAVLASRAWLQYQTRERIKITSPAGIESLEKVRLGGVEQWILIRGQDRAKPLLLFVHGGPGMPHMPLSHLNAELEKAFVVVQWDQRGAGKSYSSALGPESLTVERFVADTLELVQLLRSRFGVEKIYLVGHSWGTIVGALAVSRHPEFFHAYVGVSQVGDALETQRVLYAHALESATKQGNDRAVAELKQIGEPPFRRSADHMTACNWLSRFADPQSQRFTTWRGIREGMASPYYSLGDFLKLYRGMHLSIAVLWDGMSRTNLPRQVPRIEVPVYFLQGRHDHILPAVVTEKYFRGLDAPRGKQLIWFENSRHLPHLEEPEKYRDVLIGKVLAERSGSMRMEASP